MPVEDGGIVQNAVPEPHFRNGARVAVSAVDVRAEIPAFPHIEVADAADVLFCGKDSVGVEAHGAVPVKRARQRVPLAVRTLRIRWHRLGCPRPRC